MAKGSLKTKEEFIAFLKEKKVYRQFKDNVKNNNCGDETDLDLLLKKCEEAEAMAGIFSNAFLWADTDPQEEGFQFWNILDGEWQHEYYKDYK